MMAALRVWVASCFMAGVPGGLVEKRVEETLRLVFRRFAVEPLVDVAGGRHAKVFLGPVVVAIDAGGDWRLVTHQHFLAVLTDHRLIRPDCCD